MNELTGDMPQVMRDRKLEIIVVTKALSHQAENEARYSLQVFSDSIEFKGKIQIVPSVACISISPSSFSGPFPNYCFPPPTAPSASAGGLCRFQSVHRKHDPTKEWSRPIQIPAQLPTPSFQKPSFGVARVEWIAEARLGGVVFRVDGGCRRSTRSICGYSARASASRHPVAPYRERGQRSSLKWRRGRTA